MKITKQQMYIGLGIAGIALLYFISKGKNYKNEIGIRNVGGNGAFKYYGVKTDDRQKARAGLQVGTEGLINGTDKCTITKLTPAADGASVAFKCAEVQDGSYDIPNPSKFQY
jgi:hypothetical protein